ncbi:MAG: response regulator transcription factor [Planctomycetota bacterium]|jgi:FixJ family two-component response regulator
MAMTDRVKQHIFFVDDEPRVRKVVDKTLKRLGTKVSCFASARDCLEQLRSQRCDLLITDVKMPEMSGIELLTEVKRFIPWLPVLLVTGYGDIPMAVKVLKMGALNFLEKPLEMQSFLSAVESALDGTAAFEPPVGKKFTKTEMRVLRLILDGKSNRETAYILHRSVKTIEFHRNRIMHKFGVDNVVDLIRRAAALGMVDLLPE